MQWGRGERWDWVNERRIGLRERNGRSVGRSRCLFAFGGVVERGQSFNRSVSGMLKEIFIHIELC